jgi:hypothetical protein
MRDFLRFETMITPGLIQIVFWAAVILSIVIGIAAMVTGEDTSTRGGGLLLLIFGPIIARIYAEILIIWFRMNDHLRRIDQHTEHP